MGNVEITAENNRLFLLKLRDVSSESILPFHTVVDSFQSVLSVRNVFRDEIYIVKFERNNSALGVKLLNSETVAYAERLVLGEYCSTRIALFQGIAPILTVAVKLQNELTLLHFSLLKTENICVQLIKNVHKALVHTGSYAVDVP